MGQKPRQAPQSIPDSLPKRDEGPDVQTDAVRGIDLPTVPPDSLPDSEDEELAGVAEEIAKVDSAVRS